MTTRDCTAKHFGLALLFGLALPLLAQAITDCP